MIRPQRPPQSHHKHDEPVLGCGSRAWVAPKYLVTLEIKRPRSGRMINVVAVAGERGRNWVRNVKAAGGT